MIWASLWSGLALLHLVLATTVTVPFNDPSITYSGNWSLISNLSSNCPSVIAYLLRGPTAPATATISFEGVAVSLLGGSARDATDFIPSLDNVTDAEVSTSITCNQTLYQKTGLQNAQHKLTITVNSIQGLTIAGFTITTDDGPSSTTSSPGSSSTSSAARTNSPSSSHSKTGAIVGGAIGGLVLLTGLAFLAYHWLTKSPVLPPKDRVFSFAVSPGLDQQSKRTYQITLTLTPPPDLKDANLTTHEVAWRVFDIGPIKHITLPYDLGFALATVTSGEDKPTINPGSIKRDRAKSLLDTIYSYRKADSAFTAKNSSASHGDLVLGTYNVTRDERKTAHFYPFLLVKDVPAGGAYSISRDFVLRAYRTQNCQEGQFLPDADKSMLLGDAGVKVLEDKRFIQWHLVKSEGDSFKLEEAPPVDNMGA